MQFNSHCCRRLWKPSAAVAAGSNSRCYGPVVVLFNTSGLAAAASRLADELANTAASRQCQPDGQCQSGLGDTALQSPKQQPVRGHERVARAPGATARLVTMSHGMPPRRPASVTPGIMACRLADQIQLHQQPASVAESRHPLTSDLEGVCVAT